MNSIVLTASAENRNTIKITDKYLSSKIIPMLQESRFFRVQDGWAKVALQNVLNTEETIERLLDTNWPDQVKQSLSNMASALRSKPSQAVLLEVERDLWPLKLRDFDLPAFIVPIRPEWAMHLFDVEIASQDLFGGEPKLILNAENVYYRSSFPKVLHSPGRVLWYVSSGNKRYQGSMS